MKIDCNIVLQLQEVVGVLNIAITTIVTIYTFIKMNCDTPQIYTVLYIQQVQ